MVKKSETASVPREKEQFELMMQWKGPECLPIVSGLIEHVKVR